MLRLTKRRSNYFFGIKNSLALSSRDEKNLEKLILFNMNGFIGE
jgi:hypothetical protein